jgi:hypothetical protein
MDGHRDSTSSLGLHGHNHGDDNNRKACGLALHARDDLLLVELARAKHRLVEVPYMMTLAYVADMLLAGSVYVIAMAVLPGHWIGASGSMIIDSTFPSATNRGGRHRWQTLSLAMARLRRRGSSSSPTLASSYA